MISNNDMESAAAAADEPVDFDDLIDSFVDEFYSDFEILKCDGFGRHAIGVGEMFNGDPVLVYDEDGIIEQLIEDGMSSDEAEEYFEFNIKGAYAGAGTPMFLTRIPGLPVPENPNPK